MEVDSKEVRELSIKELGRRFKETSKDVYFNALYRKLDKSLVNYIMKVMNTSDEDKAQEVFNEVMIKAYMKIEQFDPKWSISTWLYRMAHNLSLDTLYKTKRESKYEDMNGGLSGAVSASGGEYHISNEYEEQLEREEKEETKSEVYSRLVKLIPHIGDLYKDILKDVFISNLNYYEVSEVRGLPRTTIKNRVYRGKEELKRLYRDNYGEPGPDFETMRTGL